MTETTETASESSKNKPLKEPDSLIENPEKTEKETSGSRRNSSRNTKSQLGSYNRKICYDAYEFGDFSMQIDNTAVRLRTAHLHWLIVNNVYSKNTDDYQHNLRHHSPSNSARYPIRISKELRDPEWVDTDYRVHIYHSQRDRLWLNQWLRGMLEVRRFQVTTNNEPCVDCDRVIVILSQHFCRSAAVTRKAVEGIRGKISLGIKKEKCVEPEEIKDRCHGYIDMSRVDMQDYSYQNRLMRNVIKGLFLPESVGSA